MTRPMTSAMSTALGSKTIRPVVIAYLDIASDPIAMWTGQGTFVPTGTGDAVLNGKMFYPEQAFADMSDVSEDQGIGGPVTVSLKANALDEDALRQVVRDRREWRGRAAYIWMGLYSEGFGSVIADPIRIKTGIMTQVVVKRAAGDVSIEITIDTDLQNAKSAPFRWTDHARIYPTDTFSAYVHELANKPAGLERQNLITFDAAGRSDLENYIYWDGKF
jgi:hypothetical protein